jgi:hypothetical protein
MSLQTKLTDLATRVATECKALRTLINGNATDLSSLTTTAKGNLVAALNELKAGLDAAVGAAGATINDASSASTTQTWSITKISTEITAALNQLTTGAPAALNTLDELSAALGDDANFAATITTALANRVRYDAAQGLTTPQQLQACQNIGVGDPETNFVNTFNAGLI